jgi:hypothetical protein
MSISTNQPQKGITMSDSQKDEPQQFATVLLGHAKGRAHDEASEKLAECIQAVKDTGKPATITVELTIKPVDKIPNAYKIIDKVKASVPVDPRASMWFADENNGLHRNDPNQRSLYDEPVPATDGKSAAAGRD